MAGWRRFGGGSWRAVVQAVVMTTALAIALPVAAVAQGTTVAQPAVREPHATHIADAAQRFRIPAHWVTAVLDAESAGDPRAVSTAGAMGLMQIMPATWDELRVRHRLGGDPFDIRDNIMAGAAYLREMWDRYGTIGAMLAAYNAGPGRYDEYVAIGRALPAETRAYVAALVPILGGEPLRQGAAVPAPVPADWRDAPLFVMRLDSIPTASVTQPEDATDADPVAPPSGGAGTDSASNSGLFVPLSGSGVRP